MQVLDESVAFGSWIYERRLSAGLSQKKVAEKLKLGSERIISNWEHGKTTVPASYLAKLVRLYQVPQHEFEYFLWTQCFSLAKSIYGES